MTKRIATYFIVLCGCSFGTISAATFDLTGTVRDFHSTHPDFENYNGSDPGIVESTLGIDGKPVYAGQLGNPSTSGQVNFDQWYRDVPGVNLSSPLTITLDNSGNVDPNVYTYSNNSFFPIDGQQFGDEGNPHNFHFTYEIHSEFTYQGGEDFTFAGDDDLWVFIDKQLVIDLGGVHFTQTASVDLDTLGLIVGNTYDFDLFFAERHTFFSTFRIDTSLALGVGVPEPQTYLLMGAFLVGAALIKRKQVKKVLS